MTDLDIFVAMLDRAGAAYVKQFPGWGTVAVRADTGATLLFDTTTGEFRRFQ